MECDESEAAKANYRIYRDEYVKEDNEDIYAGEYTDISYKLMINLICRIWICIAVISLNIQLIIIQL